MPPDDVSGDGRDDGRVADGVGRPRRRCASAATRCWPLGVQDDLDADPAGDRGVQADDRLQPDRGIRRRRRSFDQNVVSYLELLRVPYTGCNPRGLMLSRDKALLEEAARLSPHPGAGLHGRPARSQGALPKRLQLSADREVADLGGVDRHLAGVGRRPTTSSCASACSSSTTAIGTPAIVEQFIDGRELYVGVLGNAAAAGVPGVGDVVREDGRGDNWRIATERVKWSVKYQERHGIDTGRRSCRTAGRRRIQHLARRAYRALELSATRASTSGWTRRQGLRHRSQPRTRRSRDGEDFAAVGAPREGVLRAAARTHHGPRRRVAAGEPVGALPSDACGSAAGGWRLAATGSVARKKLGQKRRTEKGRDMGERTQPFLAAVDCTA